MKYASPFVLSLISILSLCACNTEVSSDKMTALPQEPAATSPSSLSSQQPNRPVPPKLPSGQPVQGVQNPQLNGPPSLPGSSPSEDLSDSWHERLAVSSLFQDNSKPEECPDRDGDGFLDAKICGDWLNIEQADCDDTNKNVTPANERYIPKSRFIMGSSSSHAGADESPVHIVELSGYCLDVNEVSSQDFAQWLNQNQRLPEGSDVRSLTVNKEGVHVDLGRESHPAEGVTWQEANAYCQSLNKVLPTEAQWEKAARGGCEFGASPSHCDSEDLRAYPWGAAVPTCELANHQLSASGLPKLCVSDTVVPDALPKGLGPYGHRHLAGNIWEYVADVWHPNVYSEDMRINPAGPKSGDVHVLRGGGWNTFSTNMRVANRFHDLIMGSASGFRCARSFTAQQFDEVEPLVFSTVSGTIESTRGLKGRALYVTAFDAADAAPGGMLIPGRSPIAEIRLTPNEQTTQTFTLNLPLGTYILSAALDSGMGAQKDSYVSASGSGGFGHAKENPITVERAVNDVHIELRAAPIIPSPQKPPNIPNPPPTQPIPKR